MVLKKLKEKTKDFGGVKGGVSDGVGDGVGYGVSSGQSIGADGWSGYLDDALAYAAESKALAKYVRPMERFGERSWIQP